MSTRLRMSAPAVLIPHQHCSLSYPLSMKVTELKNGDTTIPDQYGGTHHDGQFDQIMKKLQPKASL
jgi:hypothetical protein